MLIRKSEIKRLSGDIRKIIDGQNIDLRDNRADMFSMLKNDIHTLAYHKKEQYDALQHDSNVMMDMLTNVSHQLKTPLTSMMIMADLLDNAPPDKQAEFISNIKIGLTRMEWLVSALLKMAKLDAGAIEFSTDSIQSNELINLAVEPLQILLEIKSQTIEIFGEAEFFCDKRWTGEALTNILKNASEYSPIGSKICISSGENPICAWVSVTDSGNGIPNNKITGLFRRFEGSRGDKGYGIGLPLALAIMQSQNGDIEVDGRGNGSGATFTLKLYK